MFGKEEEELDDVNIEKFFGVSDDDNTRNADSVADAG